MRQAIWIASLILLHTVANLHANGQESNRAYEVAVSPDSLYHRNSFSVLFDRNLNTYNWLSRLLMDTSALGTRFGLSAKYGSNIILTDPGNPDNRRLHSDQISLTTTLSNPIAEDISVHTLWSSLVSTDNRGVGLSNASSHSLLMGLATDPAPWLTATPLAGYRWDDQAGTRDKGPSLQFTGAIHDIDPEGYQLAGIVQFHRDMLDPRTLESHFARASAQKIFSGRSRDSLELGLTRTRREFYALADSTIESRVDMFLSFSNMLVYEFSNSILTNVFVSIAGRTLDKNLRYFGVPVVQTPLFNSEITEFHLDTYIQTSYREENGRATASIRLSHSERDELHALIPMGDLRSSVQTLWSAKNQEEKTNDNLAKRTALSGACLIPFSASDELAFAAWASILRYDTPSLLNVEDRDELLVAASIATTHHISRYLDMSVSLDGTISHLVYLLKDRSANNNINRVLRLSPVVTCRPVNALTMINGFEVLANYTVYDFEGSLVPAKSFSYRQFGWVDTTTIRLNNRISLDFFVYLKLYERGQLNWNEFKERRENSTVDQSIAGDVRFTPVRHTVLAVGIRYFSQSHYTYQSQGRSLDSFLSNIGPTCMIQHDFGTSGSLNFQGWYERRRQPDGTSNMLGSMTLSLMLNV